MLRISVDSLVVFVVTFLLFFVIGLWAMPVVLVPYGIYTYFALKREEVSLEDENADGTR